MGLISRAIDKLPKWLQAVIVIAGIIAGIYYIAEYGLFNFLIRLIFSPEI